MVGFSHQPGNRQWPCSPRSSIRRIICTGCLRDPSKEESLLAEIDWYGDTVFDHMQMPRFLSQWQAPARNSQSPDEEQIVEELEHLPNGANAVHLYLKFIGD
jgi:hypothetical protein